jgi:hypothetical protein
VPADLLVLGGGWFLRSWCAACCLLPFQGETAAFFPCSSALRSYPLASPLNCRQNKEVSPVTGKQLAHRLLLPNDALRAAMVEVAQLVQALVTN